MTAVVEYHLYVDQSLVHIADKEYDAIEYAVRLKEKHGDGTPVQVVLVSEEERLLSAREWNARPFAVSPDEAARELAGHSVRV